MSMLAFLMKGGPVMIALIPLSALSLAVGVERLISLTLERRETLKTVEGLRNSLHGTGFERKACLEALVKGSAIRNRGIGHVINALVRFSGPREELLGILETEILTQERHLKERMWVLDTLITMAPLLGLLGTVLGIISSFHVMSLTGLGKPAEITGGVAQALIATATGLVIALVSLVFFNYANQIIRSIQIDLESFARYLPVFLGNEELPMDSRERNSKVSSYQDPAKSRLGSIPA